MKQLTLLLSLLFFSLVAYSQNYLETIATKSCACVEKISDTLSVDQYNMELGLCMIEGAMPYKKQIKKDYNINLDKIDYEVGQQMGSLIGIKMASVCPESLLKISQRMKNNDVQKDTDPTITGTVVEIEEDLFISISVKDATGKVNKYYWLNFVETDFDIINSYKKLENQNITIFYSSEEYFDYRVKEYRTFNIIKKLTVESEIK